VGDEGWAALGITKNDHTLLPPYSPDMHFVIETSHAIICTALRKDINAARLPARVRRSARVAQKTQAVQGAAGTAAGTRGGAEAAQSRGASVGEAGTVQGAGVREAGAGTAAAGPDVEAEAAACSPDTFQYYTERLQKHFREKLTPKWAQGAVTHVFSKVLPAIIEKGGHYPSKKCR
jgi:hypothetical protein